MKAPPGVVGFIILAYIVLTIYSLISNESYVQRQNKERKDNFLKSVEKYEDDLVSYDLELKKYESATSLYNTKMEQIRQREIKLSEPLWADPSKVLEHRKKELKNYLQSEVRRAFKLKKGDVVKRGVSELFFYRELQQWFAGKIFMDLRIKGRTSSKDYKPDLVYFDKATNLHIDIEIDEPYTLLTKEPIHWKDYSTPYYNTPDDFLDIKFDSFGNDEITHTNRDEEFLENGWPVVRFSEEQIVKHHTKCCELIQEIIEVIELRKTFNRSLSTELPIQEIWTYEQAKELSVKNYRESYLKLIGQISVESFPDYTY